MATSPAGPAATALLLLSVGVACGAPDLRDRLAEYEAAVDAVIPMPATADPENEAEASRLPPRRERRVDVPDHRIGGIDFLAIQGCRLSTLVGARNGPMGRVMVPSRRLVYELQVLEAAGDCLAGLDPDRAQRLREILEQKRAELPAHLWNALWMGEEMEAYLSSMARPLAAVASPDERSGLQAVAAVLQRPLRSSADAAALEAALDHVRDEYPAGATLRVLERTGQHLDAVARRLEGRSFAGCRGDTVRLARAFESRYLPLQAALASLDRRARARIETLDRLFEVSAAGLPRVPQAMLDYHRRLLSPRDPDGAWQRYRRAVLRHADAWSPTLRACGLLPEEPDA